MTIRYANTRWDLWKGRLAATCANKLVMGFWLLVGLLFAFSGFNEQTVQSESLGYRLVLAGLMLVFVLVFNAVLLAAFLALQVLLQRGKGVLGEHTLRITDMGLEEATEHNVSLHRWTAYFRCKRRFGYWLIYVTEDMAHLVPTGRGLLEGDVDAFVAELEKRARQAP